VTRVPWTAERQAVWESSYLQSRSQIGVGFSKSWAYELTAAGLFDVVGDGQARGRHDSIHLAGRPRQGTSDHPNGSADQAAWFERLATAEPNA
jgi:hypothetical protein